MLTTDPQFYPSWSKTFLPLDQPVRDGVTHDLSPDSNDRLQAVYKRHSPRTDMTMLFCSLYSKLLTVNCGQRLLNTRKYDIVRKNRINFTPETTPFPNLQKPTVEKTARQDDAPAQPAMNCSYKVSRLCLKELRQYHQCSSNVWQKNTKLHPNSTRQTVVIAVTKTSLQNRFCFVF